MFRYNREDFQKGTKINTGMISLLSDKTKIGIIGSGKAAFIKADHFLKRGFTVHMIGIDDISLNYHKNLIFRLKSYDKSFILDKHLVFICINDDNLRKQIIKDLEDEHKLYVDCSNFTDGNAIVSAETSTDGISIGINTLYGNPRGTMFILNKIKSDIKSYDKFIEYTSYIRNYVKEKQDIKTSVLDFIFTEDFYFFFLKCKGDIILEMFYDDMIKSKDNILRS